MRAFRYLVVVKVALGQVFLRVLRFSPVSAPFSSRFSFSIKTNGRNAWTFKKGIALTDIREQWIEEYLETEFNLNYIQIFRPYRAVNALRLGH